MGHTTAALQEIWGARENGIFSHPLRHFPNENAPYRSNRNPYVSRRGGMVIVPSIFA